MNDQTRCGAIVEEVALELDKACEAYPPMASHHEGYAIILEELDELWDEVKMKAKLRSVERMREEAIQVAAMAMRFILDTLPSEESGRED